MMTTLAAIFYYGKQILMFISLMVGITIIKEVVKSAD